MNNTEEILEFGIKRENEERRDGGCSVVLDPESQKYAVYINLKNGVTGLYGGGFDDGEEEKAGVLRELLEESGFNDYLHVEKIKSVMTHYHNSNKNVNRVAYAACYLVILKSTNRIPTKLEEHENFELVWRTPKEIVAAWTERNMNHDYDHWIYFMEHALARAKELGYDKNNTL